MAAVSKNPEFAKKAGVPQSVGEDYIKADKRKSFSGNPDKQVIAKKKTNQGSMELFKGGGMATSAKMKMQKDMKKEFPQGISKKGAMPESKSMGMMGMKNGGKVKKMADGGGAYVGSRLNMPSNTRLGKLSSGDTKEFNKAENRPYGKELAAARKEGIVPRMTKEQKAGVSSSDSMSGSEYKKGGATCAPKKMAKGGGIESKGKTKGKMC
jgi:hypothetical protein